MSSKKKVTEFPSVEAKLQIPTKQSAFERKKAEAEAKRQREAAETAAVYEDFVKSFDHDADGEQSSRGRGAESGPGSGRLERPSGFGTHTPYGGAAGKRHFGIPPGSSMKSGPGSLGPSPAGKKRLYDGTPSGLQRDRDDSRSKLGFERASNAFDVSDDEAESSTVDRAEEKATSRPTLRLANLPPGTSPAVINALIPSNLAAEHVKILPPSGPVGTERKSATAIVTLSKETPATEIEAAVSSLQNRYLGFGFYLSLHRHLSSAAISSSSLPAVTSLTAVSHPFGAKRVADSSRRFGPQHMGHGRNFVPPPSYVGPPGAGSVNRSGILHVPVQPPRDVKKLRMIHKVVEAVLEHGPEFEALLMSRPDVQREEKWAWIWDARSEGGVWYRWRLWEIVTGSRSRKGQDKYLPLFEGGHAWKTPDQPLMFEYTTGIHGFVSDSEYNSSDEDDFEDEQNRNMDDSGGAAGNRDQEDVFLNPLEKSKLAHLLARTPTSLSRLRKGDVARVTAFAITHASKGSDEIANMIVSNIERPFAYTSANPDWKLESKGKSAAENGSGGQSPGPEDKGTNEVQDLSPARLVGLYVVSDILSSASTSGIRHAWRYRQLFETALRKHKTFEILGMMAEKHD
jgi:U2-associated protein SR140